MNGNPLLVRAVYICPACRRGISYGDYDVAEPGSESFEVFEICMRRDGGATRICHCPRCHSDWQARNGRIVLDIVVVETGATREDDALDYLLEDPEK